MVSISVGDMVDKVGVSLGPSSGFEVTVPVVLCGDPALFELGAPLSTFYECS